MTHEKQYFLLAYISYIRRFLSQFLATFPTPAKIIKSVTFCTGYAQLLLPFCVSITARQTTQTALIESLEDIKSSILK